ncbi:DUF2797 domain-containing protein [Methanocella arvoryzae]|uniref:Predicted redox-active protein (CxxC motives) n=1 Tax=Methanocella arvoryzae (strain DSM 22066 / NBRC 105507 / MRE50) TaxID=351160 RepID=Q0W1I3_METAR|nr:DUF2797 domain-containing protein [Methanocella arvoryzae]CAJ37760.1 predicted redox-active protein (CxxC motives) [Methanocella arvoryzae MRE50]
MRIIGYSSIDKALVVAPGPKVLDISSGIAMTLTGRGCAGRWDGDKYIPCDSSVAPYCQRCVGAADACVICRGECRKPEKTCNEEHSVYLAVFAPSTIKVGVSRTYRLETRLNEQGADEGYEIARFPDGEAARRLERELSAKYPDRLGFTDKIKAGCIDRAAIDATITDFTPIRRFSFKYFPRELWMAPILIKPDVGMTVSGTVFGVKGQALVLEKYDTLYAMSLDSLIGYDWEEVQCNSGQKRKGSLQVSLSGF